MPVLKNTVKVKKHVLVEARICLLRLTKYGVLLLRRKCAVYLFDTSRARVRHLSYLRDERESTCAG